MAAFTSRIDARNVSRNGRLMDRVLLGQSARTFTEFRCMVAIARSLDSEGIAYPKVRKAF